MAPRSGDKLTVSHLYRVGKAVGIPGQASLGVPRLFAGSAMSATVEARGTRLALTHEEAREVVQALWGCRHCHGPARGGNSP